jgi:hypothetical protein
MEEEDDNDAIYSVEETMVEKQHTVEVALFL